MGSLAEEIRVIDADTHLTEVHDLWTKRAPARYKDRVPHVVEIDGRPTWVAEGSPIGFAGGGGVLDREGNKHAFNDSMLVWGIDRVHEGAYNPEVRLQVMDECGIYAQVLYPQWIGLGGQNLSKLVIDPELRRLCIEIYNDFSAELQDWSNTRLLPMPIMPAWDVDECVREAERIAALGLRGINMTTDPQEMGAPDLANRAWDALWEVCAENRLPVHFHIGASLTAMSFYGQYFWPSQHDYVKGAIGGSMLFLGNARDRHQHHLRRHFRPASRPQDGLCRERHRGGSHSSSKRWTTSCGRTPRPRPPNSGACRRNTSRTTGTAPTGSSGTAETCSTSSTPSARTTCCSRPTSPTRRACIRRRWRPIEERCAPSARRPGARFSAITPPNSTDCKGEPWAPLFLLAAKGTGAQGDDRPATPDGNLCCLQAWPGTDREETDYQHG